MCLMGQSHRKVQFVTSSKCFRLLFAYRFVSAQVSMHVQCNHFAVLSSSRGIIVWYPTLSTHRCVEVDQCLPDAFMVIHSS